MCLAQGPQRSDASETQTPTPRSRVKHSTTEPLRSLLSKRPKIGFQDQISLNEGQKYCRMLQGEHKLPFVIKIIVLSIFERPFYTVLL